MLFDGYLLLTSFFLSLSSPPSLLPSLPLQRYAKEASLKGFEKVRMAHLEPEPFSVDNGLLTPTFKLKRGPARDFYRAKIDEMYAELTKPKAKM